MLWYNDNENMIAFVYQYTMPEQEQHYNYNETADSTLRMRLLDGIDIVRWDTFDEAGPELLHYEVHKPVDEE